MKSNKNSKMGFDWKAIFKTGTDKVATAIGDAFDKNFTSKEERDAAKLELMKEVNRHLEAIMADASKQHELDNADRDSARKREEAFVKATGRADYFQYFIGSLAVLGVFPLMYYVLKYEIPEKNEHIAVLLVGELIGVVVSIFSYHYGSSAGSRFKDMKNK